METRIHVIEKKAYQLGSWPSPPITASILDGIKSQIQNDKGTKVKLQLSHDGLRVVKTSIIQGKMLAEYIPMSRLQFFTIMKSNPNMLFVISLSGTPNAENRYHIHVFRLNSGMDASLFAAQFKHMTSIRESNITIVNQTNAAPPQDDDINWTLRSKEHANKRELRQIVDMSRDQEVFTTTTTHVQQEPAIITNGHTHTEVLENGTRVGMYRKGKPTRLDRESFESDISDNRSEVSENALRMDLENLSQELRDIKMMLEKSTGLTAGSEPSTPRDFEPVNVKVHTNTVRPETIITTQTTHSNMRGEDNIDAVVLDDHEHAAVTTPRTNGYTIANGDVTHVRVSVPDYRASTENVSSGYILKSAPETHRSYETTYETVERRTKPNTTSYENWKKNTIARNAIHKYTTQADFPERIQWRSRTSKPTHYVTARPRSALVTTDHVDHGQLVEVRHHPVGVAPTYHRVSFNPRVVKVHERKTQSLRSRGLSSTVVRPIEQVYHGRSDAKHHSIAVRPQSAAVRPSILVKDEPVFVEPNNNVIKTDNDDALLDVSGIDLYKETPIDNNMIRT